LHAVRRSPSGAAAAEALESLEQNGILTQEGIWGDFEIMAQSAKSGTISTAVKVSQSGRLHLPSDVRKALGLKGPGHVVITVADGQATLTTMAENLARLRALARPYAPKDRLASEELIAERREEARREAVLSPAAAAGGERRARRRGSG
jgi:bifunctional DNA-binding transcriptional regulator/antitoxin component of YhaV-PrlF toxin-antitoxin module